MDVPERNGNGSRQPNAARPRRVAPALPHVRIEAIVLHANTPRQTRAAIASLRRSILPAEVGLAVTLVDNGARDGTAAALTRDDPTLRVLPLAAPHGFAAANNRAIAGALARGADWVFLLNSDATVAPDCLALLLAAAQADPRSGCAGPVVLYAGAPGRIQTAGITRRHGLRPCGARAMLGAARERKTASCTHGFEPWACS